MNDIDEIEQRLEQPGGDASVEHELARNPRLARMTGSFGTTLLMVAASRGKANLASALCELGADVNAVSSLGETPLINAIRGAALGAPDDPVGTARVLLEHGADPNVIAYDGCSALHQAIIHAQIPLVEVLLDHGADPSLRLVDPPNDENAFELARSSRVRGSDEDRSEIARLLSRGATGDRR